MADYYAAGYLLVLGVTAGFVIVAFDGLFLSFKTTPLLEFIYFFTSSPAFFTVLPTAKLFFDVFVRDFLTFLAFLNFK